MKRNFECLQCHTRFEADDQTTVTCPKCQSDNVDYARFHAPKGLWKWVVAVVVLAAAVGLLLNVGQCGSTSTPPSPTDEETTSPTEPGELDSLQIDLEEVIDLPTPPKVMIVGNKPIFKDGSYSFTASIENEPEGRNVYVAVCDYYDNSKVIARSSDGLKFEGVPASENKGKYFLGVFDAKSNQLLGGSERGGFLPQEKAASKMTVGQLQKLIDDRDPSLDGAGENKQISPSVSLKFTGIDESARLPKSLADVVTKLELESWKAVEVTNVEYDDMNLISSVTLKVITE